MGLAMAEILPVFLRGERIFLVFLRGERIFLVFLGERGREGEEERLFLFTSSREEDSVFWVKDSVENRYLAAKSNNPLWPQTEFSICLSQSSTVKFAETPLAMERRGKNISSYQGWGRWTNCLTAYNNALHKS